MRIFCDSKIFVFPPVEDRLKRAFFGGVVCMADGVWVLGAVLGF